MKKVYTAVFLFLTFLSKASAQQSPANDNLFWLGKVWGFLKYHHPAIAAGKADWDAELLRLLPDYRHLTSAARRNDSLFALVQRLGPITGPEVPDSVFEDVKLQPDYRWIESPQLSPALAALLRNVYRHRAQGNQYYLHFTDVGGATALALQHEKDYSRISFPAEGYGLLSLFRLWNVMEYAYPYKYGPAADWDAVLRRYIPRFDTVGSDAAYVRLVQELSTTLHDPHAYLQGGKLRRLYGDRYLPLHLRLVEGHALVTGLHVDSLAGDVRAGDELLAIDDTSIADRVNQWRPLISSGNEADFAVKLSSWLTRIPRDSVRLTLRRSGVLRHTVVRTFVNRGFGAPELHTTPFALARDSAWSRLPGGLLYLNMGRFNRKDSAQLAALLAQSRGWIIDLRQNIDEVAGTGAFDIVANYLLRPDQKYYRFSSGRAGQPGVFTAPLEPLPLDGATPLYKGRVAILANEETISVGEFAALLFRQAPGARLVGAPTAGANGTVNWCPLPGGLLLYFTGIGVYYPDGGEAQRVGVRPDVPVRQSWRAALEGRDEQLEKAVKLLGGK